MSRRMKRWLLGGLLAAVAAIAVLAYAGLPYLPLVHGTTEDEIARLAERLAIGPGDRVADFGAGDGTFAIAMARRVGPSGHVFATEIDPGRLAEIRRKVAEAGLANVTVIEGAVARTNLPAACCDAIYSRNVYHHLENAPAINADIFRALRAGGRLLVIDFPPGSLMDLINPGHAERRGHGTPPETLLAEARAAGFELQSGPAPWRGSLYAVLFVRP